MMTLFYLLVLSLPFVDHGFLGREIAGLTLEKLIGAGCFLYALFYLTRRRALPAMFATAQAKAFALYVALALTSYIVTAKEFAFTELISVFLSQFLFFITVMILVDSRERLEKTVLVFIGSMGLISLYLIREWLGNIGMYGLSYRPGWVAGDPNMFSASALVVLPLMLYPISHATRGWQRIGAVTCLGLTLFTFLLAASRGGFLGLVAMYLWHLRDNRRRLIAIAICVAIVLVCFASPYSPLDRILKPNASDIESSNIRLQLWSVSGKIFADHPLFGVGLWNFPKYMHQYLPRGVDLDFVVPHNTYLEAAVELGGIGLIVFLGILGFSLRGLALLRRSSIAAKDAYLAALTGSLSSGLVGFAVAALFLSAKHNKLLWFAVFLSTCLPPFVESAVRSARAKEDVRNIGMKPAKAAKAELAVAPHIPVRIGNWLTRH